MSFYRIGHTDGVLNKIKFYCVYGEMFFHIEPFLSSRRLWVVSIFINSGISQISVLVQLFSTSIVAQMTFCVRLLSELMIYSQLIMWQIIWLVLTGWESLWGYNLILKIKFVGKYLYFSSASFWFWSVKIWYLKLSVQAQILQAVV